MKYKKFILFAYDQYYPSGGLDDILGEADSLEELAPLIEQAKHRDDWYVLDRDTWETVVGRKE